MITSSIASNFHVPSKWKLHLFSEMSKMFCFPVSKLPKTLNSQRKNDEKLAELNRNRNFHFYFPTVQEHYEIKVGDPAWPEKLPISKRLEIKQKEEVTLTYKGKPFPAVYIVSSFDEDFVATSTEIGKRLQRAVEEENLEDLSFSSVRENVSQKLRATSTQSSNNLNVSSKEKKRKTAEPEVTEVDREASPVLVESEEDSDEGEYTTLDAVNTGETSDVVEAIDNVNETLKDVVKSYKLSVGSREAYATLPSFQLRNCQKLMLETMELTARKSRLGMFF